MLRGMSYSPMRPTEQCARRQLLLTNELQLRAMDYKYLAAVVGETAGAGSGSQSGTHRALDVH
jgi:hypothetical protein